jgi:ABC-type uncharacterized transport system substrate-binding protein
MVKSARGTSWWVRAWIVAAAGLLAPPGCSQSGSPSQQPKPVKLARTQKLAVIRLGNPMIEEPSDSDIKEGIQFGGVDASSFTLAGRDAKGDPAAIPGLIDAAVADGADLLLTLTPETTMIAVDKHLKIPLVFHMNGEPIALGLGKSNSDHPPDQTGVYTPFRGSLMVSIVRGCIPKAKKLGILFNPDDRYSVIHKDALRRMDWFQVEPVLAEFHSESEVPSAVRSLVDRKVDAVILTTGIGGAATAAIAEARRAKVPVFGLREDHALAGAVLARQPRKRWGGFQVGRWAGRILAGEPAGGLPFSEGVDYLSIINTGAANELGVKILPGILRDGKIVSSDSK